MSNIVDYATNQKLAFPSLNNGVLSPWLKFIVYIMVSLKNNPEHIMNVFRIVTLPNPLTNSEDFVETTRVLFIKSLRQTFSVTGD